MYIMDATLIKTELSFCSVLVIPFISTLQAVGTTQASLCN